MWTPIGQPLILQRKARLESLRIGHGLPPNTHLRAMMGMRAVGRMFLVFCLQCVMLRSQQPMTLSASDAEKDSILESFIAFARGNQEVKMRSWL